MAGGGVGLEGDGGVAGGGEVDVEAVRGGGVVWGVAWERDEKGVGPFGVVFCGLADGADEDGVVAVVASGEVDGGGGGGADGGGAPVGVRGGCGAVADFDLRGDGGYVGPGDGDGEGVDGGGAKVFQGQAYAFGGHGGVDLDDGPDEGGSIPVIPSKVFVGVGL